MALAAETAAVETGTESLLPGVNRAASINAVIVARAAAGGGVVQLQAGTFLLEGPILLASGVTLRGVGEETQLVPTWTGAADDPTNAVIQILGALDTATMDTTVAVLFAAGSLTCSVAAAGSMAAGRWFAVRGYNGTSQEWLASDGTNVVIEELLVAAGVAANVITLVAPSSQYHAASGAAVVSAQAVNPVLGASVRDIQLRSLDAAKDVAVGIYCRYAAQCQVENIWGQGFTRRLIECVGARDISIRNVVSLGYNNGLILMESCCDSSISEVSTRHGADKRINATGSPKFAIWLRRKCVNVSVSQVSIRNMSAGIAQWGGYNVSMSDIDVADMYPIPAYDALIAAGEHQLGRFGVAWMGGAAPIPLAEFSYGCTYRNMRGSNSYDDVHMDRRFSYFFLHDNYDSTWSDLLAYNSGVDGKISGVRVSDAGGMIRGLICRGLGIALASENYGFVGTISDFHIDGRAGGAIVGGAIEFGHTSPNGGHLVFRGVYFHGSEATGVIRFTGPFGTNIYDSNIHFHNLINANGPVTCDYARVVYNSNTGYDVGDVVEIDPVNSTANLIRIRQASGVTANPAVLMTGSPLDSGNGYLVVATGPQVRCTVRLDNAGNAGDLWECSGATRRGHVNIASAQPSGRLSYKSNGAGITECVLY